MRVITMKSALFLKYVWGKYLPRHPIMGIEGAKAPSIARLPLGEKRSILKGDYALED